MGIYSRTLFSTRKNEHSGESVELRWEEYYRQPLLNRIHFRVFEGMTRVLYSKLGRFMMEELIQKIDYSVHDLKCNGDCKIGQVRSSPEEEWRTTPLCGHIPLYAKIDIKHYDLDTKNNELLFKKEIED